MWKSTSELGYSSGHGDDVASMAWKLHAIEQTQLRRNIASMAWGARNLISTQVFAGLTLFLVVAARMRADYLGVLVVLATMAPGAILSVERRAARAKRSAPPGYPGTSPRRPGRPRGRFRARP